MSAYEQLREYVFGLEIYDTHEHLPAREADRPQHDVLGEYLSHYFSCDLVSAGLPPAQLAAAQDGARALMERWKIVEPYWQAARNTAYGRALDLAARDLYGLGPIGRRTIGPLNEAFTAARLAGKTYQTVLKDKSRIMLSVLDGLGPGGEYDQRFFRPTVRLDDFVTVASAAGVEALARRAGAAAIHTLEDLQDACARALDGAIRKGAICLKSGLAYSRPLHYAKTTASEAEAEFNALLSEAGFAVGGATSAATRRLQDFMFHHVCRLADRRGLTFEIHTGLQEGNGNYIAHSDPTLLTNLFLEYRNVKFDLFHIGYPYQHTLSALAKNFANVFIDFAWAHIISPAAAVAALSDYLDAVPANKISGFGGDYLFVDGVYGHQCLARENIARALASKVETGAFDLDQARQIARMLLVDNPAAIFGLGKPTASVGKTNARGRKSGRP